MPRNAIATGLVDYVLPPAEMPTQLLAYVAHAFGKIAREPAPTAPPGEDVLQKLCILLRVQTGHDFSQYKRSTLVRRVERRMAVHQIEETDRYLRYVQQNPAEAHALFRDLLIGVTSFFRDPEAFAAVEELLLPRLFANKPASAAIRIWVPGCSTGEEAYSLAILLREGMEARKQQFPVQVFATDIDREAVDQARRGVYPASIAADVPPERLVRFFSQEPDGRAYRIHKTVRDLVLFSEQDVIRDPPFSRLDLISCRNLLIYMGAELQKKLIPLFHYALNRGGLLFLGTSESVGEHAELFGALDRKTKLYQRKEDMPDAQRPTMARYLPPLTRGGGAPQPAGKGPGDRRQSLRELTERELLQQYAPVGVLVTARGEILYLHGRTGQYLEPAPGEAGMNILQMAREGLRRAVTTALQGAVAHNAPVHYPGLQVKTNGEFTTVHLTVRPVAAEPETGAGPPLFLVSLEEVPPSQPGRSAPAASEVVGDGTAGSGSSADAQFAALTRELRAKEEYLQAALEEMETSNEELKSSNEELQSVNEELQSANEELETSKEELQSVNEELATVNAELQTKVADLSRVNNDMNNLLAGTGIGTIFVDHLLRIQRFTPAVTQVINLIGTDVGRPVGHIVSNLVGYDRLVADVQAVLDSLVPAQCDVQTRSGDWYSLRIRPYRTLDNVIEGAVISFVEITEQKLLQAKIEEAARLAREAQEYAEQVLDAVFVPMLVLEEDLCIRSANPAYYTFFHTTAEATVGRPLTEVGGGQWCLPALRALLDEILSQQAVVRGFAVTVEAPGLGRRSLRLHARAVSSGAGAAHVILLAMEDATTP
jgi:two-component system CheB/CheR fusion protein